VRVEDLPVRGAISRRKLIRRMLVSALVLVVLLWFAISIFANPALNIPSIAQYIVSPIILQGLLLKVWLSVAAFVMGLVLGIPFTDIGVFGDTNVIITPMIAALLPLGLIQAAYTGEIIRGGLLSVPEGQKEAGTAMGMSPGKVFRRISLPQAIRTVIPPLGNDAINLVKATSLVSVVGVGDLMTRAQGRYANNYQVIPLLIVASIWYLILTAILSAGQALLEKRFSRGIVPNASCPRIREQGGS